MDEYVRCLLGTRNSGQTISVYDIDGTRCDYTKQTDGSWQACKGEHAILQPDPGNQCTFWWTKKSGTAYWFNSPLQGCSTPPGLGGRLSAIYGRNNRNNITLVYSFVPNQPQTSENITEIDVNHSNGQSLNLAFAQVDNTGLNELATITRPDNQVITYGYDVVGDLIEIDRPGNDSNSGNPLPETYGTNHPTQFACGPRATISMRQNQGPGTDGSCLHFDYDSFTDLIDWVVNGVLNPDPGDGHGAIQPSPVPSDWETFYTANFVYAAGAGTPCGTTFINTTTMCDSDGHSTFWNINSRLQVTQTTSATGPSTSLSTTQSWDDANNLVATTDARGNETDYGYDTNGNTVMVRQPSIQSSQGTLRPMSLYSYDSFNNITAYCDPVSNVGKPPPTDFTDSLCPTTLGSGNFIYQYTYPSYEAYGKLTDIYTPCYQASCQDGGNHTQISYSPANQGGTDYGLPTKVAGSNYAQKDGTQRAPEEDFTYGAVGNLTSYVTGSPAPGSGAGTWQLTYSGDNMNRLVMREDPDGYTTHMCYNYDGTTAYAETPKQYSLDGGGNCVSAGQTPPPYAVALTHDANGDVLTEVHHHGGKYKASFTNPSATPDVNDTKGTIKKYYDGEDRLVEVIQPTDVTFDIFVNAWLTRYYYDLTQGNGAATLSFQGKSGKFAGYGNLYKTVELLPSSTGDILTWGSAAQTPNPGTPAPAPTPIVNAQLTDLNASAFDGIDRPVDKYRIVYYSSAEHLATEALTYDGTPTTLGLLTSDCQNSVSECKVFDYDTIGNTTKNTFTINGNPDPNTLERDTTYDPDSRVQKIAQQGTGGDSDTYVYDLDGRLDSVTKQSGQNIAYHYYLDGKRESLGGSLGADSFDYSYAPDGRLQQLNFGFDNSGKLVYTLTAAGRVSERDDYANGSPAMKTKKTYAYALLSEEDFPCSNCSGNQQPPGSHASMMYSAEGELLGQLVTAPWTTGGGATGHYVNQYVQTFYYNRRGEIVTTFDHVHNETDFKYANGVQIATYPVATPPSTFEGVQGTWDSRMGAAVSSAYSSQTSAVFPVLTGQAPMVAYDHDGRNTSSGYTIFCKTNNPNGGCSPQITQNTTRAYDVENHLTSSSATYGASSALTSYTWGSNGHPNQIGLGAGNQSDAVFWDGDSLLYSATNHGSGATDDIKVGSDAEYTSNDTGYNGVTFYDRGIDGSVAFCHNASGGSAGFGDGDPMITQGRVYVGGPNNPCGPPSALPSWGMQYPLNVAWDASYLGGAAGVGNGLTIGELRADGINDGVNTIQGVRTYDPTAGQWTTPDEYPGIVHDPLTQKAYVWNNNNPVNYEDPSGYCANAAECLIGFGATIEGAAIAAAASSAAATAAAISVLVGGAILVTTAPTAPGDLATAMARNTTSSIGIPNTVTRRGNTVTYYGPQGTRVKRVDLEGKSHAGVETPHTTTYGKPNVSPNGEVHPGNAEETRSSTPDEIQDAKNRPPGTSPQDNSPGGSGQEHSQ